MSMVGQMDVLVIPGYPLHKSSNLHLACFQANQMHNKPNNISVFLRGNVCVGRDT